METTAYRLRKARLSRGISVRELAAATGLTETAIIYIEGNKNPASLSSLKKFSNVIGASVSYLGCFENLPEKTFGERLKKARLFHGLLMKEMASKLGISERTLRDWELDKREPPEKHFHTIDMYLQILYK